MAPLLLLLAWGCRSKQQEWPAGTERNVFVQESGADTVQVDSVWRQLTDASEGAPVVGGRHQWLIRFMWYRIPQRSESLYTMGQLMELDSRGVVNDDTPIGMVRYEFLAEADSLEDAIRVARESVNTSPWPPRRVRNALKAGK